MTWTEWKRRTPSSEVAVQKAFDRIREREMEQMRQQARAPRG